MSRVVALDIGSSSVRAQVYDEEARPVGELARRAYDSTDGALDADALVAAARACLDEAQAPGAPVAISCFWHSLLALDGHGRPLTEVLTWRDLRSTPQAEELRARLDDEAVHARTGCPLHPSFWPAKLAWLDVDAARYVSFPDYLLLQLTGELRTSVSMASATGLWTREGWDAELLDVLGLDEAQLPTVSDEPVDGIFPALGDGACSNVGAGCTSRDRAALMIGTSGALRVIGPDDGAAARPGLFRYRLDRERVVDGGALSDGGNLHEWLERTLRLPEERSLADRPPSELTFLPLLGGERSPGWNPRVRGAVSGLSFDVQPLDLLQAALEGVAYRFAEIADLLPGVGEVVATGHALRANPDWVQILADVLERPVSLSPEPEASARGAAVMALERLGHRPVAAPSPAAPFIPRPERAGAYRSGRQRQRDLYRGVT
jgi:gluconokinase